MALRKIRIAARVEEQMVDALAYTLERFGPRKHDEYDRLIEQALKTLEENAEAGHRRPDIAPEVWLYPISRGGGRARHVFLYSIVGDEVHIEAFRYDGMDLPTQWCGGG